MNRQFNLAYATEYSSASQRARVLSERWLVEESYCPACGAELLPQGNNKAVSDAVCCECEEEFELKAQLQKNTAAIPRLTKIVDGAYSTMMQRLNSNKVPNLFFLQYDSSYRVSSLVLIPQHFFIPALIEKRPPLGPAARRAGWIGCNILLNEVPESGKLQIVTLNAISPKKSVISLYQKMLFLKKSSHFDSRGWLVETINCIERLGSPVFTLSELYHFVPELARKYPNNKNIKAKLRQQLQVLRNECYLEFMGGGLYKLR